MRGLPRILSLIRDKLNKFNNKEHEQFRPGIIEYKRKISVALQHYIMTIVHIGFGIFQRNVESFSHTVLLSYK